MGFLKRLLNTPNSNDNFYISQLLEQLDYYNKGVTRGSNISGFLNDMDGLKKTINSLLKYERKYPAYFNPKPSEILKNFRENNKLILERNFVDRYIYEIEKKLINYSTMRGKSNNFNKMVDFFMFDAGEFEPETIKYFEVELSKNFPELYFDQSAK